MKNTKNNDIKLLALDLDGTTLTSRNTLSENTKFALQRAIASGITVVAASGRPFASMPKNILEISGIDYIISSNGAAIHNSDGSCIHRSLLAESDVVKILDLTACYDLIFEAFVEGLTYTDLRYINNPIEYGCGEAYVDYVLSSHGHIEDMREFIFKHRRELDSIEIVCTDKQLRQKLWLEIADKIPQVFITTSSENFIELMNFDAKKSNALDRICRLLKIDTKNVCACGNADNDADMIKLAGLGAAVKNASPLCLEHADIVVSSNDDDGVAELINYIIANNH